MKKIIIKYVKSIVIALCVCASLALGALSAVSVSPETPVIATHPNFLEGNM